MIRAQKYYSILDGDSTGVISKMVRMRLLTLPHGGRWICRTTGASRISRAQTLLLIPMLLELSLPDIPSEVRAGTGKLFLSLRGLRVSIFRSASMAFT